MKLRDLPASGRNHGKLLCALLIAYTTQGFLPRDGATYSSLGPPTAINNQGTSPQTWTEANLIQVFPVKAFLSESSRLSRQLKPCWEDKAFLVLQSLVLSGLSGAGSTGAGQGSISSPGFHLQ